MVALDIVHASNARLRDLGPGLVALFVGATSGIGEATLKAFVHNTISPRAYIVGRSASAAERIIAECAELNKDGKVQFLKADVGELAEVDRVCAEIVKREKHINLLVQSQGNLNLRGRDESPEGLDRKLTLNYYSRMRFTHNLLPLLHAATTTPPHLSRALSVLGPGHEGPLNLSDLSLSQSFSVRLCASHSIVMTDLMMSELAAREPGTSFVHTSPGVVSTGIARELPLWARVAVTVLSPLMLPFTVGLEETGARQLFMATSGVYAPAKAGSETKGAGGVPIPPALTVAKGADGKVGSGGYLVNWNGDVTGKENILSELREKEVGRTVWEHTMGIFERVEGVNKARGKVNH